MTNKVAVVTTFSRVGFDQYAHRMIDTWLKHWPSDVDLIVYPDEPVDLPFAPNLIVQSAPIEDKETFIRTWKGHPQYNGGKPYNYRYDAVKFCHKPFCLWHVAVANSHFSDDGQYRGLIWLDADTITHTDIDLDMLRWMSPPNVDVQFLGRSYKYTECGYLWFNLKRPGGLTLLNAWTRLYRTGQFRRQREWHDSYLFDIARNATPDLIEKDLTGHIPRRKGGGHPFINSRLGAYMDHHKGPRKVTGKPRQNDLFTDHQSAYWKENAHAKDRRKKSHARRP